jgi:hypothetical protein
MPKFIERVLASACQAHRSATHAASSPAPCEAVIFVDVKESAKLAAAANQHAYDGVQAGANNEVMGTSIANTNPFVS